MSVYFKNVEMYYINEIMVNVVTLEYCKYLIEQGGGEWNIL